MRLCSGTSCLEPPPLLLELPGPLLQAVLRLLDARGVLSVARTCSQLRDAAAAALDWIQQHTDTSTSLDSLLLYLERHGQHVSSLGVTMALSLDLPRLPASCSRLQALSFFCGRVHLGASDGQPGVLHAASALTSLSIDSIDSPDSAQDVAAAVARLTRLQRLELRQIVQQGMFPGGMLPGSMLAPLQSLTALQLASMGDWLQAGTLEHLSSLSGLRETALGDQPAAAWSALTASSGLEALDVSDRTLTAAAWQAMFGGSRRLPRLRELWVELSEGINRADLPALVCCCPALQTLSLHKCHGLGIPDLRPLTALTGLTFLAARGPDDTWGFEFETPDGLPPNVASRLQQEIDWAVQEEVDRAAQEEVNGAPSLSADESV